jgi:hypothetical protein
LVKALLAIVSGYGLFLSTWGLYLALTHIKRVGVENLRPCSKINAYVLLAAGYSLDFTFNVVLSVPFIDPPRELLATARLKRYKRSTSNSLLARFRRRLATKFCDCLLNQFEVDGNHC